MRDPQWAVYGDSEATGECYIPLTPAQTEASRARIADLLKALQERDEEDDG